MTLGDVHLVWLTLTFLTLIHAEVTPTFPPKPPSETKRDDPLGFTFAAIRMLLGNCLREIRGKVENGNVTVSVVECLKRRSLIVLDRIGKKDRLQIFGIELIKSDNNSNENFITKKVFERNLSKSWLQEVMKKLNDLFKSHLLKFPINTNLIFTPRRRHHYKDLLPILIFSILAISMIAVPLGFQFLAVLGGKALLLAKLALILTSIQGLKKIATSSLNYGLYQVPQQQHHSCKENPFCLFWNDNSFDLSYDNDYLSMRVNFEDDPFGFLGPGYDRRWQYELNGDLNQFGYHHHGYQQQPDSVLDLLHPLSPRSTSGYDSS